MTVFTNLCRYINQQFTVPTASIKSNHQLQKDLGLNDIELTEVVVFLELLYGLTLPDELLVLTLSVGQLCSLIEQHMDNEQLDPAFQVYRNSRQVFSQAS